MSRLLDIDLPPPRRLRLRKGDLVRFAASGGRVESGEGVVEPLGAFVPAVIGTDGEPLSPESGPTAWLLRAIGSGEARLTLYASRGGFAPAERHELAIRVD